MGSITEELIQTLETRYPGVPIRSFIPQIGADARSPAAVLTYRAKSSFEKSNRRFAAQLFTYLWSLPVCPTAPEVADWIEGQIQRPPDWPQLVNRLRHWPAGSPFTPIPDDDSIFPRHPHRWWSPGSKQAFANPLS